MQPVVITTLQLFGAMQFIRAMQPRFSLWPLTVLSYVPSDVSMASRLPPYGNATIISRWSGPSSLGSGAPSSASVFSDSGTEINSFIDNEERDELLGDIFSEEDDEDKQEEEDEDGSPPAKRAKFMLSGQ